MDLFDKREKTGFIVFETKYIQGHAPRKDNENMTALMKGLSAVKHHDKDAMTAGIKALIQLKIEQHQKQTIQTRIKKLVRDESKAKKRIEDTLRKTRFMSQIQEDKIQKM